MVRPPVLRLFLRPRPPPRLLLLYMTFGVVAEFDAPPPNTLRRWKGGRWKGGRGKGGRGKGGKGEEEEKRRKGGEGGILREID